MRLILKAFVTAFVLLVSVAGATAQTGWTTAGTLNQHRYGHAATRLPSGKVLIVGGWFADQHAELYDPATGTWTATPPMNAGHRGGHIVVLLPNGKVLVAGGQWPGTAYSTTAELYDPATNTWTLTGAMNQNRGNGPAATLLPNGKVLVAGGSGDYPTFPHQRANSSAELYDPATGSWTLTGSMGTARDSHAQVLLPNGKVLAAAGGTGGGGATATAEVYDPATGSWSPTGSMLRSRTHPLTSSLLLPNGKVLVAGGDASGEDSGAELYDPVAGTWAPTGDMTSRRSFHTLALLPNGKVLAVGGFHVPPPYYIGTTELYDPATGVWSPEPSMTRARAFGTSTVLQDGRVLAAGGYDSGLGSAELYQPAPGGGGGGIPGLVAHYTFDNNDAADSSGNGHNGVLQGGVGFSAGPAGFGNALELNLGKYVTLPSTNTLKLYDHDFTVSAWVNATAFSGLGGYGGDWAVLGNQLPAPVQGSAGLHLALRDARPYMGFFGNDMGSGANLLTNTWYHIVWRYTKAGGEMAMFLNGALLSIGGGHSPFVGTGSTFIGRCCETWDAPRFAKGRIDDVQIYDRPLTAAEIASLGEPQAPADTTPPSVVATVSGGLGNNGWYTSNVGVTWAVTDEESTAVADGCDAQTVNYDTSGVTFTCSATSDGGTATESVTVKRDATAPMISGSRTPAANGAGWNNTDVAVSFTCNDGLSGLASCTGDTTLSAEGAGQSTTGTATDLAGNTAEASIGGINIDKTAPAASVTSPAAGATYALNQVVTAAFVCADALSGVAACTGTVGTGAAIDTASVGGKSFTVTAIDQAGNTAPVSVSYRVAYTFGGFRQPIPLPVSMFKGGSTIPVKFALTDGAGASVGTAVATVSVKGGAPLGVAAYDPAAQQYHFNLKTKGLPLGPLTITVRLDDGTSHSVVVTLR